MTARTPRNRNRLLLAACLMALAAPLTLAQTNAKLPEFEVATVKPTNPNSRGVGLFTYPGGRIVATNYTLKMLIHDAFNVQGFQISGGPAWAQTDLYDVEAKPPASSLSSKSNPASFKEPPNDEQRQMLQALLIDRFQLKFHREDREGPVYLLTKGDKPLKLTAPKDPNVFSWAGSPGQPGSLGGGAVVFGTGMAGTNITMPQLAVRLSGYVHRPVLDRTGLTGAFDFEYRIGDPDSEEEPTVTVINSLKEVGLKLTQGKGPVEIIVIDSAQKPSEN